MFRLLFRLMSYLLLTGFVSAQDNAAKKLDIVHLKDSSYMFITYQEFDGVPFPANGLYVVGDTAVVMIDTPWDKNQLQPLLDTIYKRHHKKVRFCLPTHFHDDRTQGLQELQEQGVTTFSSSLTKKWCAERKQDQAQFSFLKDTLFSMFGISFETFYPGKGHTEDNIILYFPEQKLLYGGCFIKSIENESLGFIGDAFVKEWAKSVKKVIKKYKAKTEIVIPGHFAYSDNRTLEHTLTIIKKRK